MAWKDVNLEVSTLSSLRHSSSSDSSPDDAFAIGKGLVGACCCRHALLGVLGFSWSQSRLLMVASACHAAATLVIACVLCVILAALWRQTSRPVTRLTEQSYSSRRMDEHVRIKKDRRSEQSMQGRIVNGIYSPRARRRWRSSLARGVWWRREAQ